MASLSASGQTWYWTSQADSSSSQTASQVAVDRNDNPFYTGYCSGTRIAFGNIGLDITGFQDDFLVKYTSQGVPVWARNAKALNNFAFVYGMSVATDRNNDVIEAGYFDDSIAFGIFHLQAKNTGANSYIVKYDANGNLLWATSAKASVTPNCQNFAYTVTTDKMNNILVTGYFMDTAYFGSHTLAANGIDIFLVKYSSAGSVLWAKTANLSPGSFAYSLSVATDDSDNSYIAGNIYGTVTFGATAPLTTSIEEEVYLAKYDSMGNAKWSLNTTATPAQLLPTPVAVDKSNNIYLGAQFTNLSIHMGPSIVTNGSTDGASNALLAKYTRNNGTCLWATCADYISQDEVNVIIESSSATDKCKNVYWSGLCSDTFGVGRVKVTIAGGAAHPTVPFAYVIQLDSNGNPIAGAALANQNANSFSNYFAVDSLSKALFVSELVNPATLVVGNDTVKRYFNNSTCFISKFAVLPPILNNNGGNDSICSGDSATLSITPIAGTTFTWSTGATTSSIIVKPPNTTTYFVAINNGCIIDTSFTKVTVTPLSADIDGNDTICKGDTTLLTGRGGAKYLWNTGETTSAIKVAPETTTTYTLNTYNGNCSKDTTFTVFVLTAHGVSIRATPADSLCKGDSVLLSGSGSTTYLWSTGSTLSSIWVSPAITSTYTLHATSVRCPDSAVKKIAVIPETSAFIRAQPDTICPGGTSMLTIISNGGPATYKWNTGASTSTIYTNDSVTTKYSAVIYGICDSVQDSVTVTVVSIPKPSFSADIMSGCVPLCVQFTASVPPSIGVSQWGWNFGNGDSVYMQSPAYCYKDTGVFSVDLTETYAGGCSNALKVINMIRVYPLPIANFMYAPQPVNILNPLVQFTNLSTGKYPIEQWHWTFGDKNSSSSMVNPEYTYSDTGIFCTTLSVMDLHGCIDSVTNCLVVNPLFTFYIPDAFTPNGDGMNDVFMPKGSYVKNFEMYIFDRWGNEFFHSTDINYGWNGTVQGSSTIAKEDVYVYLINVTDSQDNKHSYTGNVTLLK